MVTAGALAEVHECRERTLLGYLRVGAPLLAMAAARAVAAVAARAWRPHPLDWSIHEEVQTLVMREVLSKRDLGVWRAMFSVAGGLFDLSDHFMTPIYPGSKSMWVQLRPELEPKDPKREFVLLWVHGGAFVAGSALQCVSSFDKWLKVFAAKGIKCKILTAHYPLAPEHPYPAGREAVEDVITWLFEKSGEVGPFIIGGDSAGGNLSLAGLAHLRDTGRLTQKPLGLCYLSPAVDLSPTSCIIGSVYGAGASDASSMASATSSSSSSSDCSSDGGGADEGSEAAGGMVRAESHDYLPLDHFAEGLPLYYVPIEQTSCPYVSPTNLASFAGLVEHEIVVLAGGAELMLPDIRVFVKKLKAAEAAGKGPKVTYYEAPGKMHAWPVLMLPGLEKHETAMWEFYDRMLGL